MAFIHDRRVYFSDTDGAGVVFFAQILTFCHDAYEASLAGFGIDLQDFFRDSPLALPIINCEMDFIKPIFCGELLQIAVTGERGGESEFITFYQISASDQLRARGRLRHCAIDRVRRVRVPLPCQMLEWLDRGLLSS
ncbi:MAG: acyl-CoA thioesterase [Cyanobacteria bacterium KgW148]|nr:acyl-CoA thioesterase [Cyanobacteria bacterium KgW148]